SSAPSWTSLKMSVRTMARYVPGLSGGTTAVSVDVYDSPGWRTKPGPEPGAWTRPSGVALRTQTGVWERETAALEDPAAGVRPVVADGALEGHRGAGFRRRRDHDGVHLQVGGRRQIDEHRSRAGRGVVRLVIALEHLAAGPVGEEDGVGHDEDVERAGQPGR